MSSVHRKALEHKFKGSLKINTDLNRTLVSFQANKKLPFYRWFKYKEGFSAPMMNYLISDSGLNKNSKLLDPFSGSGVALFAALNRGLVPSGIEILPVGPYIIKNRIKATKIPVDDIDRALCDCLSEDFKKYLPAQSKFNHISITEGAFPKETEKEMLGFINYARDHFADPDTQSILEFAVFCILEKISYTRKDGQYLRWDYRAGKNPLSKKFNKGHIPGFREAITEKLSEIREDLLLWNSETASTNFDSINLTEGSVLKLLPEIPSKTINIVITSPPYCNRYDYTRTYALELAFLGINDSGIKQLRQELLTCTVENREKTSALKSIYTDKRRVNDFNRIVETFNSQEALQEVIEVLDKLRTSNNLNNPNIVRMVKNYFFEMCFIIFELYRVLKNNGIVYMVNDNVRYGGEEIPVDLILSDFASTAGFNVRDIWTLNTGKGNSSQQMGVHGRTELRKCVYVWQK